MDRSAQFDALFDRHRKAVHAFLLGRTGDRDHVADLLQETFVRVWRNLDSILAIPEERQLYYLLRTAASVTVQAHRRQRITTNRLDSVGEPSHAETMTDAVYLREIDFAIMRLPEDLRTVLVMAAMAGMSSVEIGEALDRPAGTVRYQLHEARERLLRSLGGRQ